MPWLKGLVIGLGVLLAAGMGLLVYGFAAKLGKPPAGESGQAKGPAKAFGAIDLALPAGCAIAGVTPDGARLYLLVGPAGSSCERVVVLDAARGAVLGEIKPRP
jgi:hypothetical protein